MKSFKTNTLFIVILISVIISIRCGEMGGKSEKPDTIIISGVVGNNEVPDASVAMKNIRTGEIISTETDDKGVWSIAVDREKIVTGDTFLLTATNPANRMTLRSMITADDIISSGNSFSSDETAISSYTETAYLTAQTENISDIAGFLKQTIKRTDLDLPKSTGNEAIDAMAVWIKGEFEDSAASSGETYTIGLLDQMISSMWPTIVISGTDISIKLPPAILSDGAIVSVNAYQGIENVAIEDETIIIGAGVSENVEINDTQHNKMRKSAEAADDSIVIEGNLIKIMTGSSFGRYQVKMELSKGDTKKELSLPINILRSDKEVSQTVRAKDTTPVEIGNLQIVPDNDSFFKDTQIHVMELDMDSSASK